MASTVWKGTIAFGMVTIPVKLTAAARSESISFNMLHVCGSRINQKTFCPKCNKDISRNDTHKGFEVSKDTYVTVTAAELENIEPDSNKVMEISEMVPSSAVDPLCFDASYYIEPDAAGHKGYSLLYAALVAEKRYAIAKITMHSRENNVIIRPAGKILVLHTMFYQDEIRNRPTIDLDQIKPQELALARKLVSLGASDFDHSQYRDEYKVKVRAMIESKSSGISVPQTARAARNAGSAIDILSALEASLVAGVAKAGKTKKKA